MTALAYLFAGAVGGVLLRAALVGLWRARTTRQRWAEPLAADEALPLALRLLLTTQANGEWVRFEFQPGDFLQFRVDRSARAGGLILGWPELQGRAEVSQRVQADLTDAGFIVRRVVVGEAGEGRRVVAFVEAEAAGSVDRQVVEGNVMARLVLRSLGLLSSDPCRVVFSGQGDARVLARARVAGDLLS
jgi:hypothetical protein